MTTDTTPLEDRLWDAISEARDRGERTAHDVDSYDIVEAILPIIAAEVQAAQAEGWDEGYLDRSPYGGRARSRADNPYHTTEKESKHDD